MPRELKLDTRSTTAHGDGGVCMAPSPPEVLDDLLGVLGIR